MNGLSGTRTLGICETIGFDRHVSLLDQYLDEPQRLHQERQQKLEEITTYERTEWQLAKTALEVEESRLFLIINETPSDNGRAAAAAEALRLANIELAQAKERLDVERSRLLLQVVEEVDDKGKPKYANGDLRDAKLAVLQAESQTYRDAANAVRMAEEKVNSAKTDLDAKAPKPKFSNADARNAALIQLQQTDIDYQAALAVFRTADLHLAKLKGEADDLQQQIANVSAKLWGLRELVKGDSAVLMAVSTLDGPGIPREILLRAAGLPTEITLRAPDSLPPVHVVADKKEAA